MAPRLVEDFSTPRKRQGRGLIDCGSVDVPAPYVAMPKHAVPMPKRKHMQDVGRNLRLVRDALGLTQLEMANQFGMKDKSKVSNWERGINYPDPYFVLLLWQKYRVTADWLYLGERGFLPHSVAVNLPGAGEE